MVNNKEKNFISAVLYIHNNEKEIETFIETINKVLSDNFEKYEIICVNDGSSDRSVEVIKKSAKSINGTTITCLNMSFYQGIERAMCAGVDLSIGDFVYEFDTMQMDYDVNMIMDIYWHSLKGFDIVSATPKKSSRKSSRLFYKIFNKFSNTQYDLKTETFRILSRRGINRVNSISNAMPYRKAIYTLSGLKIDSIDYDNSKKTNKLERQVNDTRKDVAIDSFILFTDIAYKLALIFSIIMISMTAIAGIYVFMVYFGDKKPVEGWAPIMGLSSLGFCGIFVILTVVIKYLNIILSLLFKKQKYLIESIEKLQ